MTALLAKLTANGSGTTSVCSGHPLVLEAAMRQAVDDAGTALIEATCNQVNHTGGYTGLTPGDFAGQVNRIADQVGLPMERVVLGGDHLGPSPWRSLPAEEAMAEAEKMVEAYVAAGYQKIHLDTSMGCRGEPAALGDDLVAERAARLAVVAERAAAVAGTAPSYVIGTEVPTPGGALHEIDQLHVTRPEAVMATLEAHRKAFSNAGVEAAFERVMAVVTQPGVEFDHQAVVVYQPQRATQLSGALRNLPGLVFEAHSTDYQPAASLARLVVDGFAILKVGPGLTFAMREALYALDAIASFVLEGRRQRTLVGAMEEQMLANPKYWDQYYHGTPDQQRLLRHFSYSDRIRYYWSAPAARDAVDELYHELATVPITPPMVSQYFPALYARVASGAVPATPRNLVLEAVGDVMRTYSAACRAPRPGVAT